MVWVTLILNIKPIPFARELLGLFCKLFEEEYYVEIQGLYDRFEGNVSIFRRNLANQKNIDEIIEEIFHISLSLPHKINHPKGKKLPSNLKKIFHFAKQTVDKTKGVLLLNDLFNEAINSLAMSNDEIASSIYNLVFNDFLIPVESER